MERYAIRIPALGRTNLPQANAEGWVPSSNDKNAGVGARGACWYVFTLGYSSTLLTMSDSAEMDIWEANSISTALTPHSCDTVSFSECSGEKCGGTYSGTRYDGPCDPNGCKPFSSLILPIIHANIIEGDFNPYRLGVTDFYGKGKTVDTSKPFTVVTQFLGSGSTLSEIKRYYVQNGKVIENPQPKTAGITGNSITQAWCDAENKANKEDVYPFKDHGGMLFLLFNILFYPIAYFFLRPFHDMRILIFLGMSSMAQGMAKGMVLVMSLWDDHYANMLWLDSTYPTDASASAPGAARGDCPTSSGVPADVESNNANAQVKYSNIRFGPIGSTFKQP